MTSKRGVLLGTWLRTIQTADGSKSSFFRNLEEHACYGPEVHADPYHARCNVCPHRRLRAVQHQRQYSDWGWDTCDVCNPSGRDARPAQGLRWAHVCFKTLRQAKNLSQMREVGAAVGLGIRLSRI